MLEIDILRNTNSTNQTFTQGESKGVLIAFLSNTTKHTKKYESVDYVLQDFKEDRTRRNIREYK